MSSIQHFTAFLRCTPENEAERSVASSLSPCSAYFPSLHRSINDQMLCMIVGEIGYPSRIDWVEMAQPKKNYRSAFVHFDWGRADLIGDGPTDMSRYIEGTDNYAITMLPARNPVPNTVLNIHQVANNLKVLEESMWGSMNKQAEQIRDLEDLVQAQREQLANQAAMIKLLLEKNSYPSPPILKRQTNSRPFSSTAEVADRSFWSDSAEVIRSTMRDEAERSVASDQLSGVQCRKVDVPVFPFPNMTDESDADDESVPDLESGSVSTHSSMPSLIDCFPDSWDHNDDMYPVVVNVEITL